jgi:hypothetical protein
MLDSIAVPSGSGSSDRVVTACAIGFFSLTLARQPNAAPYLRRK